MVIKLKLSTDSIDNAIKEIKTFNKTLDKNIRKMLDLIVIKGEEYAVMGAAERTNTLETVNSIRAYRKGNLAIVEAGGNAVWVEFGAGVVKNPKPYPGDLPSVISAIGTYGQGNGSNPDGWYFSTDTEIKYLSPVYVDDDGMYVYHTYGIERTAFMYNTLKQLEEKLEAFAKVVKV